MKYSSQGKQMVLEIFTSPLEKSLDPENRWYKLANAMPWDRIEILYNAKLQNKHSGAGNKSARMVIGALIIKHIMCLSDEGTIEMIKGNPYMQYFVGISEFCCIPIFDSSLFVSIRKRLGVESINEITLMVLETQKSIELEKKEDNTGHERHQKSLKIQAIILKKKKRMIHLRMKKGIFIPAV